MHAAKGLSNSKVFVFWDLGEKVGRREDYN